jgi:hypothetical protein
LSLSAIIMQRQVSKILKYNLPNSAGFAAGLLLGLRS